MTDKQAWELVDEILGSKPLLVHEHSGRHPFHLEHHISNKSSYQIPALPQAIVAIQIGGKKITRITETKQEATQQVTFPSVTLIIPPGKKTMWSAAGVMDMACFYFHDKALKKLEKLLIGRHDTDNTPIIFTDPVTGALGQQLITSLSNQEKESKGYITALSTALFEQICNRLKSEDFSTERRSDSSKLYQIHKAISHIHNNVKTDLSIEKISKLIDLQPSILKRIFQQTTGTTIHQYVIHARIEQACHLLRHTSLNISAIADECGFSSQSHMTSCFRRKHNVTPREFRIS